MNSLKKLIKDKSPWLTVLDAFELIKNKTDLQLNHDIAEFLISIEINDFCIPYNKSHYFNGQPERLHRDFDNKTLSKMDLLLIDLASQSIAVDDNNPNFKNYVWLKEDFFYQFERFTEIDLEVSEQVKNENKSFPLYFKNKGFSIHEAVCLMTGYNPTSTSRLSNQRSWLEEHPEYEEAFDFIYSAVKSGFFGDSPNEDPYLYATKLKEFFADSEIYIDGFNKNSEQNDATTFDSHTIEKTTLKNYQRENQELAIKIKQLEQKLMQETAQSQLLESDYQSSQNEIRNLKSIISEKDKTIQKLKDEKQKENGDVFCLSMDLNNANEDFKQLKIKYEDLEAKFLINSLPLSTSLLEQIFDETVAERYAPDLVSAIKLWEYIYITNPKKEDSHSNKADTWLKNNTSYDTKKKGGLSIKN